MLQTYERNRIKQKTNFEALKLQLVVAVSQGGLDLRCKFNGRKSKDEVLKALTQGRVYSRSLTKHVTVLQRNTAKPPRDPLTYFLSSAVFKCTG